MNSIFKYSIYECTGILGACLFGHTFATVKKAKKHQEMLDAIKKGDKIITRGGLYANVTKIENETDLLAEVADNVVVKLSKNGILAVVNADKKNITETKKNKINNKKTKK